MSETNDQNNASNVDGNKAGESTQAEHEPQLSETDFELSQPQLGNAAISADVAESVNLDEVEAEAAKVEREAERSAQLPASEVLSNIPPARLDFTEHKDSDVDESTVLRTDFTKPPVASNPWSAPTPPTPDQAPEASHTPTPVPTTSQAPASASAPDMPLAPPANAPQAHDEPAAHSETTDGEPLPPATPESGTAPAYKGRGIDDGSGWHRPQTPWQQSATPWQPKANAWQSPGQLAQSEADAAALVAAQNAAPGNQPPVPGQSPGAQGAPMQPPAQPPYGQPSYGQAGPQSSGGQPGAQPPYGQPAGQPPYGQPGGPQNQQAYGQPGPQNSGGQPGAQPPYGQPAGQPPYGQPGGPQNQQANGQPGPQNSGGQPGAQAGVPPYGAPAQRGTPPIPGNPGGPGAPWQNNPGGPGNPGGPTGPGGPGAPWQNNPGGPSGPGRPQSKNKLFIILGVAVIGIILVVLLIWMVIGMLSGNAKVNSGEAQPAATSSAAQQKPSPAATAKSPATPADDFDVIVPNASPLDWIEGDCLRDFASPSKKADVVVCSSPHSAQLVGTYYYEDGADFPGTEALSAKGKEVCAGVSLTNEAKSFKDLKQASAYPSESTWTNSGDRRVDCLISNPSGNNLNVSLVK